MIQKKKSVSIVSGLLVLLGLHLTSLHSYLLFHSIVEIFSIVVACGIFMLAWNSRRFLENTYLLFLGVAYLFVGGLDLIHTLAYTGMGVFEGYGTNLPTQLWIAARYVESFSLLIAPLLLGRKLKVNVVFLGYISATSLLLASIFYWNLFPTCFIEGTGLTPFKKISEYTISLMLLASIAILLKKRRDLDVSILRLLIASIVLTIASELAFTLYVHAYGLSNMIGHYLKIASFYLIYKAIIETGLARPYALLFRNLKHREEALRESEESLKAILNSSAAAVLLVDTAGTVLALNETSARSLGKPADELLGSCIYDALPPAVSGGRRARAEEVIREARPVRFEDEHQGRWFGNSVYPVFDAEGKVTRLAVYVRDITERKRTEDELRKLSRAVEESPATVVITDAEGTIEYVNPKFVKLTGYTAVEAIGQNPRILKSGKHPPEFYQQMWETITRGKEWRGEFYNKKKNGDFYWEFASISPIKNEGGVITNFVGVKEDITERKRAEEALQKAHDELEQRVDERTAELKQEILERERAQEALRESEGQLRYLSSQLLSAQENERKSVAQELHDSIGQTLAAIKFGAEKALENLDQRSSRTAKTSLEAVVSMVQNGIEEVRRIQMDLRPPTLDDLGILATISWFCREFQRIYSGIRIEQQIDIQEHNVPDPLKTIIYRVLQEALNNVVKHSKADRVRLSLRKRDGTVELAIEDNGQGFDVEDVLSVESSKRGIGVSSMRERTELSGGSFAIESVKGTGTTIRSSWPERP